MNQRQVRAAIVCAVVAVLGVWWAPWGPLLLWVALQIAWDAL